jgi:hypothetical protein
MKKETEAVAELARGLGWLRKNRLKRAKHLIDVQRISCRIYWF